jgi:hypothetical protein
MMNVTGMVVFGALLGLALYDVLAIVRGGVKASVSQFITNCSVRPRIAFVCGCLVSHFFGWVMIPDVVDPRAEIRSRMFVSGAKCQCEMHLKQCEFCRRVAGK